MSGVQRQLRKDELEKLLLDATRERGKRKTPASWEALKKAALERAQHPDRSGSYRRLQ
jgi:hypothetical protein